MEFAQAALVEAKAKALINVAVARAEARKAAKVEVAAVRAEADQVAEETDVAVRAEAEKAVEDEFGAGFFQGYSDLKMKVALTHPEWDLIAFSGVDSDYWAMEVSAEKGDLATEAGTSATGDAGKTRATGKTEEDTVEVDDELSS